MAEDVIANNGDLEAMDYIEVLYGPTKEDAELYARKRAQQLLYGVQDLNALVGSLSKDASL